VAGGAVEEDMGGIAGACGESGIVAEVALQEDIDGFFEGAVPVPQIAGEAGVELGSPVGLDQNQAVEVGAEFLVRGDFAVGEQDPGGGNRDLPGGFSGDGVKDGLLDGASIAEIFQAFS